MAQRHSYEAFRVLAVEFLEPEGPRSWVGPRFGDEEAAPGGKPFPQSRLAAQVLSPLLSRC